MLCECPATSDQLATGECGTPDDPEACGRSADFLVDGVGATCATCLSTAVEVAADNSESDHVAVSVVRP